MLVDEFLLDKELDDTPAEAFVEFDQSSKYQVISAKNKLHLNCERLLKGM